MAEINSFPNNQDEYIGAEEVMRWLHGRTSGVYGAGNNAAVTPTGEGMSVSVSAGTGWLTDQNGNGIVWWNDSPITLSIGAADSTLHRIVRIVVHWEVGNYAPRPQIIVLDDESPSSSPTPPALTNNNLIREISLARVYIGAGTTVITSDMITDERLDPTVCGLVTESVAVDTSMIDSQFEALLASIEEELRDLEAGTAVELKKLTFSNVQVAANSFVADSTYADFGFRAPVALTGVNATMIPEVVFGVTEAISGSFAPVAETYSGGVYIYADAKPSDAITIPTIICWRQ